MRIGVLLPVLAVIIGSRIVELTRVGTWIPAAVGIAVGGMPLACRRGISRGDGCGHEGDRQQLGDEKSHGRSSAWIVFGVDASRVQTVKKRCNISVPLPPAPAHSGPALCPSKSKGARRL